MNTRCGLLFIAIIALLGCGLSRPGFAQPDEETFVLVTFEGVSLAQLTQWDIPAVRTLLQRGSIGLMNNRANSGDQSFEHNAVTIGSGTRALGGDPPRLLGGHQYARYGYNANERVNGATAAQMFSRNIGLTPPADGIVHLGIAALDQLNTQQQAIILPGQLGQLLVEHGVAVSVYGNSDQGAVRLRNAVAIAMDRDGRVAEGDVGSATVLNDPARPFGIHTNFRYFAERFEALSAKQRFIVFEAGDGARTEAMRQWTTPERYDALLKNSFTECSEFTLHLDDRLRASGHPYRLCLAIVAQNDVALQQGDKLTPVILLGTDLPAGVLTSATSKRPGLIANIDITASVLDWFAVPAHESMLGCPMTGMQIKNAVGSLQQSNTQMVATYAARPPILKTYIIILALSILAFIVAMVYCCRFRTILRGMMSPPVLKVLLIALTLVPLALLLAPGVHIYATLPTAIFLPLTTVLTAMLLHWRLHDLRLIFAVVGLATSGCIAADLFAGAALMQSSLLGYDAINGVRYYGLGNEYSGVFIGSLLLGCYALMDYYAKWRAAFLAPLLLICIAAFLIIGMPKLGSDFGGMLSAIPGFLYAVLHAYRQQSYRKWLYGAGGAFGVLFIALLLLHMRQDSTHIGRAFVAASQNGPTVLWDIALRKWAMNLKLIHSSFWALALLSLLIGTAVVSFRPVGLLRQALGPHPVLNAGFLGICVGMVVGLLTNDSGVVMAATGFLYLTLPLMLLVMAEVTTTTALEEPGD